MKKIVATFLIAVLFLSNLSFAQSPKTVSNVARSIVEISSDAGDDKDLQCTGFQVGINWVLTAEHCLPRPGSNVEIFVNKKVARLIKRNLTLGLLSVGINERPALTLRKTPLMQGELVSAFGYGWGLGLHVLYRHVAQLTELRGRVILDGPLITGMSGGPVVDSEGYVVGLSQAGNEIIGIASNSKEISEFLGRK